MFKILEKSLTQGAEFSDLYFIERNEDSISFDNDKLKAVRAKNVSGFTLRVKKDGKAGIVSSSNLNNTDEVLKTALDASSEGEPLEYEFNRPVNLAPLKLTNDALFERSIEEYVADGEKFIKLIKDYDPNINAGMDIWRIRQTKGYMNSYGCDYVSTSDELAIFYGAILVENENILEINEPLNLRDNSYNVETMANNIIQTMKIGRIQQPLNGGKMPVILTPNALAQFFFSLIYGLSGDFVRLGMSPLKDRLGEQVLSEQFTLIDDPTLSYGFESAPFDDEGTPSERTVLYDKGVLQNFLLSLKAAHALNMKPNGKGQRRAMLRNRDYANMPNCWFSNVLLEPGNMAFQDMLKEVKEGILIDSASGLIMGDLLRGDIDSDIDLGFKIENGQITGRVKDAAIGANIYELFKNQIVGLENQVHQAVALGSGDFYLPHILLKDVNIVR